METTSGAEGAAPQEPMVPQRYGVSRVRRELSDTFTLELEPLDGPPVPFAAGQFNMLYAFGVGESAISISGDPGRPGTLGHTVRAVGSVTRAVCSLRRGEQLGVRGPFGSAWPLEASEGCDVVIVAGGIGLAPVRPALYRIMARRSRYGRVALLFGARTPRDILYRRELQTWRGRFDMNVEVSVDQTGGEPFEHVGFVTRLIQAVDCDPLDTVAFVCGPEIMMRFSATDLAARGIPPENIHLSLERNMKCAVGLCGHCQFGSHFVCKDGPVFRYSDVQHLLRIREV